MHYIDDNGDSSRRNGSQETQRASITKGAVNKHSKYVIGVWHYFFSDLHLGKLMTANYRCS